MLADVRRSESRKYGFRQSSYINFKVDGGYFFCLSFLTDEARLTVKPMYADDLWWDIWDASENKKEPMSLRGNTPCILRTGFRQWAYRLEAVRR